MSEQDNRRIAEEVISAVNAHDLDRYVKLLDDSYIGEAELAPGPIRGPEGARKMLEMQFQAFPDFHLEAEQILTSGDFVIVRTRMTGTQKGSFFGIAPTNKAVSVQGCGIVELRNGKAVRGRVFGENAKLLQQLGVLSLPRAATA